MPIYDPSYRPYRGVLSSHAWRWWTITRAGVQQLLTKRIFLVLLTITFFVPVAFGVRIWIAHQFPEQKLFTVDADFFELLMKVQLIWFLVLIGGATVCYLIADHTHNPEGNLGEK